MNKFVQNQTFYENIDSFNDIISGIKESDKRFVEMIFKKNFTITLYTFWESNVKKILFNHLVEHANIIFTEEFLKSFYRTILNSPNYVKEKYLDSLDKNEIQITQEYYLSSNNLWFDKVVELIQRIYSETSQDNFLKFSNSNLELKKTIEKLEQTFISKYSEKKANPDGLEGYIDSLVNNRNNLAHTGECSEYIGFNDMKLYFEFISHILITIEMYLKNLYIQKSISEHKLINITSVICGTRQAKAIVEVTFDSEIVEKFNQEENEKKYSDWYIKKGDFFYPIAIEKIKDEDKKTVSILPDNGHVTLEIKSCNIKVTKRGDYNLLNLTYSQHENHELSEKKLIFKF